MIDIEGVVARAGHVEVYQVLARAAVLTYRGGVAVARYGGRLLRGARDLVLAARLRDRCGVVVADLIYVDLIAIAQRRNSVPVGGDVDLLSTGDVAGVDAATITTRLSTGCASRGAVIAPIDQGTIVYHTGVGA